MFHRLFSLTVVLTGSLLAQVQTGPSQCSVSTSPPLVRSEGVTERVGDILLQCSFGNAPTTLTGSLEVFLSSPVTNPINASGVASDALLLMNSGSGYVPTGVPGVVGSQSVTFNNINLPVPSGGQINLKISSIRVNASQLGGGPNPTPITANLSFNIPLNQSQVTVAYAQKSLYDTIYDTGITCVGSPVPSVLSVTNLYAAGTALASTRFTDGFAGAFQPRGSGDTNGTRFLMQYSGFPTQTQVYLPDFVAGSDAAVPTSGGDLGMPQAVGQYLPGSGTLLLARVLNADNTGTGGTPATLTASGSGAITLDSVSPVLLTNGGGYAVYEVVDANLGALESVQFPTFIGISNITAAAVAQETVSYAPVSSAPTASQTAPVPRFKATTPTSDCSIVGDCNAGYFPVLGVETIGNFSATVTAGGNTTEVPGNIYIGNNGGGILNWAITVNYLQGSGWILLDYPSGENNATVRVWAKPQNLTAGTYLANLVVSGGGPMSAPVSIPVTVIVQPAPTPTPTPTPAQPTPTPTPSVTVSSVVNAASLTIAPLVPGSLGTVMGSNLAGKVVAVTFDSAPATLLYNSPTQINLQVPASLDPSKTSSSMVVTVDGVSSNPYTVVLAPASPSIFNGGVLNQDYSANAPTTAAAAGTILQIFATGIPASALVTVEIAGQGSLTPVYAGPAPGLAGVQQVDVAVPSGLASGATPLVICALAGSQQYCSANYTLYVK